MLHTYSHPKSFPRCREIALAINGQPVEVLKCDLANFAICVLTEGPAEVVITAHHRMKKSCSIHPRRLGLEAQIINNQELRFTLPGAESLLIRTPGFDDLYLVIHDRREEIPDGDNILRIPAGQTVEAECLDLDGYDGLHIEGGAVLKGRIHARDKKALRIGGHGIFDGSFYTRERDGMVRSMILDHCPDCIVEDITMVNPTGWMIVLVACDGAQVRRVMQLGKVQSSDGIDVVGSSDVLIEDCFLSNNDDCIVVKALVVGKNLPEDQQADGRQNVTNVHARRCVLVNGRAGNAMEIGHELSVDSIRQIRFEDIDVVNVHGHGAVFSIHNYDRALVEDITYENIRIEHCYDMLIDFRISRSRYSTDEERGRIRNVVLKDVHWDRSPFNEGYTHSVISGWDENHRIEDVTITGLLVDGKKIDDPEVLEIAYRHADTVSCR